MNLMTHKGLAGMASALEEAHSIYGELTVAHLRILVFISRHGKASGQELVTKLKLTKPNVSRALALLGDEVVASRKAAPLALITFETDPVDRRYKYAVLTDKGEQLAQALASQF